MKTYRTAEIAALVGVHPNTVRFYEAQDLLPPVPRRNNGYRVYSARHLLQLRFLRLTFRAEILSDNLRGEAIAIAKTAAASDFKEAVRQTLAYRAHLREELAGAREAVALAVQLAGGAAAAQPAPVMGRREAAAALGVSVDVLRDWERNGLLEVPRRGNRRRYGARELRLLKIIRVLRRANYSQMAIRRMLGKLERGDADWLAAIDTPEPAEEIVSVADRYITSLSGALRDTRGMLRMLRQMESHAQTLQ